MYFIGKLIPLILSIEKDLEERSTKIEKIHLWPIYHFRLHTWIDSQDDITICTAFLMNSQDSITICTGLWMDLPDSITICTGVLMDSPDSIAICTVL